MKNEVQTYKTIETVSQNISNIIDAFGNLPLSHAIIIGINVETALILGTICFNIYTRKRYKTSESI